MSWEEAQRRLDGHALGRRVFDASEWDLMNPETGEKAGPGDPLCMLATLEIGSTYRIYQRMDGQVVIVGVPQFLLPAEKFYLYTVGPARSYPEALRVLADFVETL